VREGFLRELEVVAAHGHGDGGGHLAVTGQKSSVATLHTAAAGRFGEAQREWLHRDRSEDFDGQASEGVLLRRQLAGE